MDANSKALATDSAPILSLHQDTWASISWFLAPNDLVHLSLVGNSRLADRIRLGATSLDLAWTSTNYIDLDLVFAKLSSFKRVLYFAFDSSPWPSNRLWTPVAWSLPPTLISLTLRFSCAISFLVATNALPLLVNTLKYLEIVETESDKAAKAELDFALFPSSLTFLRISSETDSITANLESLTRLPLTLESFHLELDVTWSKVKGGPQKPILPPLPSSLTSLRLFNALLSRIHINASSLPASLRYIHLRMYNIQLDAANSTSRASIDFSGANLPVLHTLIVPALKLTASQCFEILPPSLTKVDFQLLTTGLSDPMRFANTIAPKMVKYYATEPLLDDIIFSETIELPHLQSLEIDERATSNEAYIIPKSVKKLKTEGSPKCKLPEGLLYLTVTVSHPITHYPPNLKRLVLDRDYLFPASLVATLPNTLETFTAKMKTDTISELFRHMQRPQILSFLRSISLRSVENASYLAFLPEQLEELDCHIHSNFLDASLSTTVLQGLKNSKLVQLTVSVISDDISEAKETQTSSTITILNHLPSTLKKLDISNPGTCLSSQWHVTLPPSMTCFWYTGESYLKAPEVANGTVNFKFPPKLVELLLYGSRFFPMSAIPPKLHLVHEDEPSDPGYGDRSVGKDKKDLKTFHAQYFDSRRHEANKKLYGY